MKPPEATTLGELLRELVERYPDRPAMTFEGASWTFRELDRWVDELAKGMLALDVRQGDIVSVLAGNRPEWLATTFAAMRIGATVAPMNTWYKAAEMAHLLEHAQIKVLFMVPSLLSQDYTEIMSELVPELLGQDAEMLQTPAFPDLRYVVEIGPASMPMSVGWDEFVSRGSNVADEVLREAEAAVEGGDLAYILYTSGSTSNAKGVRLHHQSILANDFEIGERQHLAPEDRAWIGIPLFYGLAAVNVLPAVWTHGACAVLQETFDAGEALALMESEAVTVYCGMGNMTRALLDHPSRPDRDISSLKKGLAGLSAEDKRLAIEGLGITYCCSMYGLTESYGNCAVTDADDSLETKLNTVGRPLPGWNFRVVDPDTEEEVAIGVVGELRIKGHVTSGYHRDEELTKATFDARGYFRTGDLVTLDEDGRVRFRSRIKEMIKVGGINVSPQEVETVLRSHPDVRQAHVVGIPDEDRGEVVCAFVERASDDVSASDLRAFVRKLAASFKVPKFVFFRQDEDFPRVASGKVPKYELQKEAMRELGHGTESSSGSLDSDANSLS